MELESPFWPTEPQVQAPRHQPHLQMEEIPPPHLDCRHHRRQRLNLEEIRSSSCRRRSACVLSLH